MIKNLLKQEILFFIECSSLTFLFCLLQLQKQDKQKSSDTYGTPPDPDDWEPDDKFEKHNDFDRKICKYKDSEAHTNGFKDKSPAPKDGQKNLPGSYRFSESGRVAVDAEANEIIIYRKTATNEYHGYTIKPETLVSEEHQAHSLLYRLKLVDRRGVIRNLEK